MERRHIPEQAQLQRARVRQSDARSSADGLPRRVVRLFGVIDRARLAVVAVLAEVAGPERRLDAIARVVLQLDVRVAKIDRRVVVHGTALGRRDDRIAVRSKSTAVDEDADLAPHVARRHVDFRAVAIPVLRADLDRPARCRSRHEVDDAAHRVVPVQAGARAIDDFDPIDSLERHSRPVHPAAERVVERDAVEEDERAAHAARPDAAKRDALRGRMRREAARPAEQAEGRNLTKHIVGDHGRRLADLLSAQHADARRQVAGPLLAARGSDGDRLGDPCRFEHELDTVWCHATRQALPRFRKPAGAHDERRLAVVGPSDRELPVRRCGRLSIRTSLRFEDDRRARDDAPCPVAHDPGHGRRNGGRSLGLLRERQRWRSDAEESEVEHQQ